MAPSYGSKKILPTTCRARCRGHRRSADVTSMRRIAPFRVLGWVLVIVGREGGIASTKYSEKGASRSFTQGVTNCRTGRRHVHISCCAQAHDESNTGGTTCRIAPSRVLSRMVVGMRRVGRLGSLRYSEKGARGSFS